MSDDKKELIPFDLQLPTLQTERGVNVWVPPDAEYIETCKQFEDTIRQLKYARADQDIIQGTIEAYKRYMDARQGIYQVQTTQLLPPIENTPPQKEYKSHQCFEGNITFTLIEVDQSGIKGSCETNHSNKTLTYVFEGEIGRVELKLRLLELPLVNSYSEEYLEQSKRRYVLTQGIYKQSGGYVEFWRAMYPIDDWYSKAELLQVAAGFCYSSKVAALVEAKYREVFMDINVTVVQKSIDAPHCECCGRQHMARLFSIHSVEIGRIRLGVSCANKWFGGGPYSGNIWEAAKRLQEQLRDVNEFSKDEFMQVVDSIRSSQDSLYQDDFN